MSLKTSGRYRVDMAGFDAVIPTMMPNCSARQLADIRALRAQPGPRAFTDNDENNNNDDDYVDDDDDYFNTPPTKMRYKPRRDGPVRRFRLRRRRRRPQSTPEVVKERKDDDRFAPSTFHADYIIT